MIKIKSPEFDLRNYYGGKLNNNIKYILINDKYLKSSYVSISVNVGAIADPLDCLGLAHFLEHMLFMGSTKYPKVDYFFDKLQEFGGYSNAYTEGFHTVYYFNVFNEGLNQMIDIFSRFFIDPLFKEETVKKEMNAVNEEHLKNINNDDWKFEYFKYFLTDKTSFLNKFSTGSLETLNKPEIRKYLLDFYNNYYTSDNISICIASSLSINEMNKIILDTFNIIEKKESIKLTIQKPLYSNNKLKTFHLLSLADIYKLVFMWEIPNQNNYLYSKDFNILKNILLNTSENSLYFKLQNLGYLINIDIEINFEGTFLILFYLTELGYNNIEYIQSTLLNYLDDIFTNYDIKKYSEYYKKVDNLNFNLNEKLSSKDLCNFLSTQHFYYDTEKVIYNALTISEIKNKYNFKEFINENNYIKILISNICPIKNNLIKYLDLPYYKGTKYVELENIKIKTNFESNNINKLVLNNNFLDLEIKLINNLDNFNIPVFLEKYNLWYGGCSKFNEPIIKIFLQLYNNNYFDNPINYLLTNISINIINFIMSFKFYNMFELFYGIYANTDYKLSSIIFNINALNDIKKLQLLMNQLFDLINNIEQYFDKLSVLYINNLIDSFKHIYKNIDYLNPSEYSKYLVNALVYKNNYFSDVLLYELDNINYNSVKKYIKNIFKDSILTKMIYGNIDMNNIDNLFNDYNTLFINKKIQPIITNNILDTIVINHPNQKEESISVSYFFYIGKFIPYNHLLMLLTVNILSQPFFNILRTKKQLGYLVNLSYIKYNDDYYIVERIQSNKKPKEIKKQINKFNRKILSLIDENKLKLYITKLKNELMEPDYNLNDKYHKYVHEISSKSFIFYRKEILIQYINNINYLDLKNFVLNYLNKENRIKIIIK